MHLLITIVNGLVVEVQEASCRMELEKMFVEENEDYGRMTNEEEMAEGFVKLEDGETLQMFSI